LYQERVAQDSSTITTPKLLAKLHKTIKKCTAEMAEFKFNTSIAAMMECANLWSEQGEEMSREDAVKFLSLLAPFAPYMTEELYQKQFSGGQKTFTSIHRSSWPSYQENLTVESELEIAVQINGKFKARVRVSSAVAQDKKSLEKAILEAEQVQFLLKDKVVKQAIVVPGRLVNFVS
jgi:leucyl-tRNA synthetase